MSNPGSTLVDVTKPAATPSTPVPAPATPQQSAQTSGDPISDLLNQVVQAKQKGIDAQIAATRANAVVNSTAASQVNSLTDDSLSAYHNLQNIQRFGGSNNPIIKIMSLFDDDWSQVTQQGRVQTNQIRASQIGNQAEAAVAANNQMPTIANLQAELATSAYSGFKDILGLKIQEGTLANQEQETRLHGLQYKLDATRVGIAMSQEQRDKIRFQLDGMSMDQKQAALDAAQKNPKSPWAPVAGMLQDDITKEQTAETALHTSQTAAANGDLDLHQKSLQTFANNLPVSQLTVLSNNAVQKGDSMVTMGSGKNQVQVPLVMIQSALTHNNEVETAANNIVTQQTVNDLSLPKRMQTFNSGAAMLSSVDPRANTELQNVQMQTKTLNPKDYGSIQNFDRILTASQQRLDAIATQVANNFKDPEAKAAVVEASQTGQFTPTGGQAVVLNSMGNPALQKFTKYQPAWQLLNTKLAEKVAAAKIQGMPDFSNSGNMSSTQALSVLAYVGKNPDASKKLPELAQEVLSDPKLRQPISNAMAASIQPQAATDTLKALAGAKGASHVWQEIQQHPELVSNVQNGHTVLDPNKLATYLEQQSVMVGGKVSFMNAFLQGLQSYAYNSDDSNHNDPSYTMYDRALEASLFGQSPHRAVLSDFVNSMRVVGARAHAEMQKRIGDDISGRTQQEAVNTNVGLNMLNAPDPLRGPIIQTQNLPTGSDVPSATGVPLTAAQVAKLYGKH